MKKTAMRRWLASVCLCALLAGSLTVPAGAAGLRDVRPDHWAASAISRCVAAGWFQGKSAETFGVGQPMTRAAFAVVLSRFFGWQSGTYYQVFSDVPQGAWYEPALRACYEHGAVTRQTSTFRPGEAITREEMAVMLIRALGFGAIAGTAAEDALPFRDVSTNKGHIAMAYDLGLVNGVSADIFAPGRAATREQAAVMLARLEDKLEQTTEEVMVPLSVGETADLTKVQTVLVTAGTLSGGGRSPQLTLSGGERAREDQVSAVHAAGCKVLLAVSGQSGVLSAVPAAVAEQVAEAVIAGGYDGVYLDISQPQKDDGAALGALTAAVKAALPEKLVYAAVDAPVRGTASPDHTALGKAADRVVVRIPALEDKTGALPVCAMEAPESLFYALEILNDQIPAAKLAVRFTADGSSLGSRGGAASVTAEKIEELERGAQTYWSDRYACAYLQTKDGAVWYLNAKGAAERQRMLGCFGVRSLCLTTASGILTAGDL